MPTRHLPLHIPSFPRALANDIRNALAHGYFKVDLDIVWETIHRELPPLHACECFATEALLIIRVGMYQLSSVKVHLLSVAVGSDGLPTAVNLQQRHGHKNR